MKTLQISLTEKGYQYQLNNAVDGNEKLQEPEKTQRAEERKRMREVLKQLQKLQRKYFFRAQFWVMGLGSGSVTATIFKKGKGGHRDFNFWNSSRNDKIKMTMQSLENYLNE